MTIAVRQFRRKRLGDVPHVKATSAKIRTRSVLHLPIMSFITHLPMLSVVMFGSESPVRMQSYPAGVCTFDRLVCTYRLACMQYSLPVVIFSADSVALSASTVQFSNGLVSVFDQRLYNYRSPMECPTGYTSPKRPATHVATASKHIGRLSKCQLAGVQLPTGFDILARPFHSRPTMQFSTG